MELSILMTGNHRGAVRINVRLCCLTDYISFCYVLLWWDYLLLSIHQNTLTIANNDSFVIAIPIYHSSNTSWSRNRSLLFAQCNSLFWSELQIKSTKSIDMQLANTLTSVLSIKHNINIVNIVTFTVCILITHFILVKPSRSFDQTNDYKSR